MTLWRFIPGESDPIIRYDVASASSTTAIAECSGPKVVENDEPPPSWLIFASACMNEMDASSAHITWIEKVHLSIPVHILGYSIFGRTIRINKLGKAQPARC